jgi:hypothetical protein
MMALKQFVILNASFSRRLSPKMLNGARKRLLTGTLPAHEVLP